jgi:signal transduction histidine kinase
MTDTRRLVLGRPIAGTVGRCRAFAVDALVDWSWLPAADEQGRLAAEDVLLVVSELVSNACLHAGGPVELTLRHRPGRILIEVTDRSPAAPVVRPPGDRAQPGGHGLRVVTLVSSAWGARPSDGGKTVWAQVGAG